MAGKAIATVSAVGLGIALQVIAAVYFVGDAISESGVLQGRFQPILLLDLLVAGALVAGIAYAARAFRAAQAQAHRSEQALAMAREALGTMMHSRFAQWGLSRGEADVALFALKGFSPAETAQYRGSAQGTVRSQLSAVYAKAGVSGQPMLMALFLGEMIDLRP